MSRLRRSLGAKLLIAQLLVVVIGSLTLLLVAVTAGPWLFDHHLQGRLGGVPAAVDAHIHTAFEDALGTALIGAVAAASATAVVISVVLTRRIVAPIRQLADGASQIASGRYGITVPVVGEDELASLARAFNGMAAALSTTERTRTRLIADVAHELRTPLSTLDGYLEGLADGVIPPDADTWSTLRDQTRRLSRLAEDLALVSRAEEGRLQVHPVATDAVQSIHDALQAARPAAMARGVSLSVTSRPERITVLADPERLQQVLGNLLDNAIQHTPAGGHVEVVADQTPDAVRVEVIDSGEGIPADELERIFTRFHRVDPARTGVNRGSGIGLTVARALVAEHGGRLTAASAGPGHGSRFTITLPRASDREAERC
ncbi:MAG: ATP-binding protein [Thermoleophilia bacterium]